jgi:hypothetical protein
VWKADNNANTIRPCRPLRRVKGQYRGLIVWGLQSPCSRIINLNSVVKPKISVGERPITPCTSGRETWLTELQPRARRPVVHGGAGKVGYRTSNVQALCIKDIFFREQNLTVKE